jgi:hypothetical protein
MLSVFRDSGLRHVVVKDQDTVHVEIPLDPATGGLTWREVAHTVLEPAACTNNGTER